VEIIKINELKNLKKSFWFFFLKFFLRENFCGNFWFFFSGWCLNDKKKIKVVF